MHINLSPHPVNYHSPPNNQLIPISGIHIDLPIDSELPTAAILAPSKPPKIRKPAPSNPHPMTTRARDGILNQKLIQLSLSLAQSSKLFLFLTRNKLWMMNMEP